MSSDEWKNRRAHRDSESVTRTAEVVRQTLYQRKYSIIAVVTLMLTGSAVMLVQPLFFKMLFDSAIPEKDATLIWWLLAAMVVTPLAAIGISYCEGHLRRRFGNPCPSKGGLESPAACQDECHRDDSQGKHRLSCNEGWRQDRQYVYQGGTAPGCF